MNNARERFVGTEFDWFMVDGQGSVALCSSAGYGEIPASVLGGLNENERPIDLIDDIIARLPVTGTHDPDGHGPGDCLEWRQLGDRGVYVYDWKHWDGPYERIIVPEVGIRATAIDPELLRTLRPVVVECVTLTDDSSFQVSDLGVPF